MVQRTCKERRQAVGGPLDHSLTRMATRQETIQPHSRTEIYQGGRVDLFAGAAAAVPQVHYVGKLKNGTVFDQGTEQVGRPLVFTLGEDAANSLTGNVIQVSRTQAVAHTHTSFHASGCDIQEGMVRYSERLARRPRDVSGSADADCSTAGLLAEVGAFSGCSARHADPVTRRRPVS